VRPHNHASAQRAMQDVFVVHLAREMTAFPPTSQLLTSGAAHMQGTRAKSHTGETRKLFGRSPSRGRSLDKPQRQIGKLMRRQACAS